jgi:hypothetical protein
LEYRLRTVQDALLDQHAQTSEGVSAVDQVKVALLERDGAQAAANNDLLKTCAALAEVQTVMAEKETVLATAQTQLQQDHATLEGAQSCRSRPSRRPRGARS